MARKVIERATLSARRASKGSKGGSSAASTSASSKGNHNSKKGSKDKPRVVYFSMHDSEASSGNFGYMASFGRQTPPAASEHPSSGPASFGPPSVSDLLLRGFSADQALQELLKYENMVKQFGGAPGSAAGQVRALGNAEEAPRSSESLAVTTHGGQDGFSQPVTSYPLGSHLLSQALCTLLDMDVDEKDDAEAYGGYGGDQGPSLPAHSVSQEVAFEKLKTFGHLDGEKPSCLHQKLTKRGSNGFVTRWSCKDCGKVLNEEKKQQQSPPKASSLSSEPSCQHHRITWSGSNGSRWRQTCLDCGKITTGLWDEREPSASTRHLGERSGDATFRSRDTSGDVEVPTGALRLEDAGVWWRCQS